MADWIIIWNSEKLDLTARLVDKQVLMTLLGATTIQLGIIMISISRFLFPTK